MVEKRMKSAAFITPLAPCLRPIPGRSPKSCPQRQTPRCAAVKLLVLDLQEVLRESSVDDIKQFSERVSVDRERSEDTTYVLYNSEQGYTSSIASLRDSGLVEPDALSAVNGSELYQSRYRTPDPYWAKTMRQGWDPKPTRWVVNEYFGEKVVDCHGDDSEEFELVFQPKAGEKASDELCNGIVSKLAEMGIKARVNKSENSEAILIAPAAGSAAEVVAFCQMMMRIPEESTFVFGQGLLDDCLRKSGSRGICNESSVGDWKEVGDRMFFSKKRGLGAVLDGVLHYAIF